MEHNDTFTMTYSAKEREEVDLIRKKYLPRTEDKLEKLRRLDRSAGRRGTIVALIVGIVGSLVMGGGMSMTLVWGEGLFVPGIVTGIFGIVGIAAAYPLYAHITERDRRRLAPEILKLTDDLLSPEGSVSPGSHRHS